MSLVNVARYISRFVLIGSAIACLLTHVSVVPLTMWHVWPLAIVFPVAWIVIFRVSLSNSNHGFVHGLFDGVFTRAGRWSQKRKSARWRGIVCLVPWYWCIAFLFGLAYPIYCIILSMGWAHEGAAVAINGGYVIMSGDEIVRMITVDEFNAIRASEARAFAALTMYFAIFCVIFYDVVVPRVAKVRSSCSSKMLARETAKTPIEFN